VASPVVVLALGEWDPFRGTTRPPEVDSFGAAIVARVPGRDQEEVKQLLGGGARKEVRIEVEKLPGGRAVGLGSGASSQRVMALASSA
jgi:hypothetical protein